jgi:hypothetical protein
MNISSPEDNITREMLAQEKAEQLERLHNTEHDNSSIDLYRFIHRVLRQDNIPSLPQGFSDRVIRLIRDFEENAQFEKWVQRIIIIIAAIAAIFYALPQLMNTAGKVGATIELPWPMFLATALALAFAAAIDYLSRTYLSTSP